jgi:hypothetical protein
VTRSAALHAGRAIPSQQNETARPVLTECGCYGRDFRAALFCIAVFMFFAVAHKLKTDSGVRIGLAVFKSAM